MRRSDYVYRTAAKYAASVWAVMDCFAGIKITEELNGPDIHRLENVMTLESGVHDLFDSLRIWLEETVGYVIKNFGRDK